ncbi:DUF1320 family protein [Geobacter pelophilus]|uniref:DUF1320 family protein n=1 Tax=Geoanaerobacter pelophilus TaxID=60036 RepID=A0AAW4LD36_9BACT|nr:DUF1320 domain-containing protein [Geoanaerobacter pelophilus]MBT0666336.1 DUF1320 family protein [Geoanaerobacter pelophilus]
MPYCTVDDIKSKRIPEQTLIMLTDDQALEQIDTAVVDGIIADADEVIDGYLRGRYELPLATVPGMIKTLSVDISAYNLYGRRSEFETPKTVNDKHAVALKILGSIQKGEIKLGAAGVQSPETATANDGMLMNAPTRLFTEEDLSRY